VQPILPSDPTQVGRYELEGRLGNGGMGTVYLGRSPGGRLAAVKMISTHLLTDPDTLSRFQREVNTLRTIRSAYTAALIDSELAEPPYWMATEFIPGPTLSATVGAHGPMPVDDCLWLIASLAEGLADIHAHGICHRDLKPQNVILSNTGPQLIDFGLARGPADTRLTQTDIVVGTPGYLAPELLTEDDELTPAADVFALGATIAHAATGRKPYGSGRAEAIYFRLLQADIDLAGVDPGLAELIRACVSTEPARRPTPQQIIERYRKRRTGGAVRPASPLPPSPPMPLQPPGRPPTPAAPSPVPGTGMGTGTGPSAASAGRPGAPSAHSGSGGRPVPPHPSHLDNPEPRPGGSAGGGGGGRNAGPVRSAGTSSPTRTDGTAPESARRRRRMPVVAGVAVAALLLFAGSAAATLRLRSHDEGRQFVDPVAAPALWPSTPSAAPTPARVKPSKSKPSPTRTTRKPRPKPTKSPPVKTVTSDDGRCIHLPKSTANGAKVEARACDESAGQQWRFTRQGVLMWTVSDLTRCLDTGGNGGADIKYRIQLWDCNNSPAQLWVPQADGALFNAASDRCLSILPKKKGGPALAIQPCTGKTAQSWKLPRS
jgi:serine/threonine protein kinase